MSRPDLNREAVQRTLWVISAFATVSWRAGQVEITSIASGVRFATENLDIIHVLHAFAQPKNVEEAIRGLNTAAPERVRAFIDELIDAKILVSASAPETPARYHWDCPSLWFHRNSRPADLHGVTKVQPEISGSARDGSRALVPLNRGAAEMRDLAAALDRRRSLRSWPHIPISFDTFSMFFWLSARNRLCLQDEVEVGRVSRPYPSGGGIYTLDIYPVLAQNAVESLAGGLYRYLPEQHALETISTNAEDTLPLLQAAGKSAETIPPPIALVITSHYSRQSEVYENLAFSLVLKEVGCLFQTFYLVGEYLGLSTCALGGGTPAGLLARICNTDELEHPVVGEFMLGPR